MNTQLINYLNQYFEYIKKIFLEEYSPYLNYDRISEINEMKNVFNILNDSKFKIYTNDKINICLDIDSFILDNNLMSDAGLKDIDISAKIYIKFLKDNKNDINRLILSIVLKPIIEYLIKCKDDVITIGLVDLIVENLSKKYNIKYIKPYESKEKEVLIKLTEVLDEQFIYESILNCDLDKIKKNKIDEEQLNEIFDKLNLEYNIYLKRKGKVYYSDSLYDYQNINYEKEIEKLTYLSSTKEEKNNAKKLRIKSIIECIDNMKKNVIVFNSEDKLKMENCYQKIINLKDKELTLDDYELALSIEDTLLPLVNKLWNSRLTNPYNFNEGTSFCLVVGKKTDEKFVETRFITDIHLVKFSNILKSNYGFVYKIKNNIVYTSSNDILITKTIEENDNTIKFNNESIDIDNQKDSRLITPDILLRSDVKNKCNGRMILYEPEIIGVYVIYDSEFNTDYKKAIELSENYELPLIKINKNLYHMKIEPKEEKKEEKIVKKKREFIKKERFSLSGLINGLIYDETENEEIKKKVA